MFDDVLDEYIDWEYEVEEVKEEFFVLLGLNVKLWVKKNGFLYGMMKNFEGVDEDGVMCL